MELYMGNVWWASSNRTLTSDANEIKGLGFNTIRIPLAPQTLDDNDPQGRDPVLKNTQSVRIQGAFSALKAVMAAITSAGMHIVLDIHSCSNYLGWRAGRFDAKPPWADTNRNDYDFKRDDCSCAASGNPAGVTRIQAYDASKWQANLRTLAGMTGNIMGIDIFNEPHDYTWTEWRGFIDQAYTAINGVNSNILVFAEGIGNKSAFGGGNNPNWGENLYEAGTNPPTMPKERLVFEPHCYGPSVCTQDFFADWNAQPQCKGIIEDAFGDAKCQIVINPAVLEPGWDQHFGYLKAQGYAVCIGEFGGNMNWPAKAETRMQNRYSYLTNKQSDLEWQNAFVNYLIKKGITDTIYWSINPESSDTYGIFTTPYDPVSNTGGWGTWSGTDSTKLSLLAKLWGAAPVTPGPTTPGGGTVTRTPAGGTTPPAGSKGDVNGDSSLTIVDALMIAQYTVGLGPSPFNNANADVNCDGTISIVDALMVAQRYVGLISSFPC
jgi:aryl-phospho-beta-D-glucosidase BglC (GH1 family)